MAANNRTLGKFALDGIPPAPRGVPQIEVTFKIDSNGILCVSAKDKTTGREQEITIKDSSGLSESEVERMVKDAEEHAAEDEEKRKLVEARNQVDQLLFQMKKLVEEHKEAYPEEVKKIEETFEELEKAKDGDNVEDMQAAIKKTEEAAQDIGKRMYEKAAAEAPAQEDDKEAVDAEFKVVD